MIIPRRNIFSSIVLVSLIFFSGQAVARDLTWSDVVAEAKAKNPALVKAKESLDQARWALTRSYSNFLPKLSASAGTGQSQVNADGVVKDFSYGLSGSLSLFTGFANTSEVKSRSSDLRIAEATYTRTLSDTLYALKKGFYDLLWAQETVRLSEDILKRREENYDMVQLKYESGREDKGSLMRIDADRTQARYNLEQARRALQNYSLALGQAIGRDDLTPLTVTGTMAYGAPAPSIDLRQLIDQTPEHLIARSTVEKAVAGITSAQSSLYPSLSLSAGTSRSGPQWNADSSRWNIGFNLSYPFFTGGKNIYDIKIARSAKAASDQSLRQTDQALATKLNSVYTSFIDAVANVGVREKYLAASETQSRITTQKYVNGLASYLDWYTFENDFINSQRSLLNARHDAVLSEAQFQNALGAGEY